MNKTKTMLFSIVPTLICVALQFFAVYYLLFIAAIFLFGIGPVIKDKSYNFSDLMELTQNMDFNTIAMIIFSFCCIIIFGIWYKKRCDGTFRINIKKDFHPLEITGLILLVPGIQYLSALVTSIISMIFPSWLEIYEELLETVGLGENITLIMFIYSVLMAPISEELIFRGVTLRIAQRALPFGLANILQAALFGLFHMNPLQSCYTFIIGLILGYIVHKGGTIYHVIFFHLLFNLWGTVASQWILGLNPYLQSAIVICSLVLGLGLGFYCFNLGNQKKQRQ